MHHAFGSTRTPSPQRDTARPRNATPIALGSHHPLAADDADAASALQSQHDHYATSNARHYHQQQHNARAASPSYLSRPAAGGGGGAPDSPSCGHPRSPTTEHSVLSGRDEGGNCATTPLETPDLMMARSDSPGAGFFASLPAPELDVTGRAAAASPSLSSGHNQLSGTNSRDARRRVSTQSASPNRSSVPSPLRRNGSYLDRSGSGIGRSSFDDVDANAAADGHDEYDDHVDADAAVTSIFARPSPPASRVRRQSATVPIFSLPLAAAAPVAAAPMSVTFSIPDDLSDGARAAADDTGVAVRHLADTTLPTTSAGIWRGGLHHEAPADETTAVGRTAHELPPPAGLPEGLVRCAATTAVSVSARHHGGGFDVANIAAAVVSEPSRVPAIVATVLSLIVFAGAAVVLAGTGVWWLLVAAAPVTVALLVKCIPMTTTRVEFLATRPCSVRVTMVHPLGRSCTEKAYHIAAIEDLGHPHIADGQIFFSFPKRFLDATLRDHASAAVSAPSAMQHHQPASTANTAHRSSSSAALPPVADGKKVTAVVHRFSESLENASTSTLQCYAAWRHFVGLLRAGTALHTALDACAKLQARDDPSRVAATDDLVCLDKAIEAGCWIRADETPGPSA